MAAMALWHLDFSTSSSIASTALKMSILSDVSTKVSLHNAIGVRNAQIDVPR